MAAGSADAETKFMNMMGLTMSNIQVQKENVFCDEETEAITTALNHRMYCDEEEVDPYFTPDEFRVSIKKNCVDTNNSTKQKRGHTSQ